MSRRAFVPEIESIHLIQKFVKEKLSGTAASKKHLLNIDLVIEEIVVNIVKYGLKDRDDPIIEVEVNSNKKMLHLIFIDNGVGFNPLGKEDPDTGESAIEKRGIGGLGIFLIKQFSKDIKYSRKDNFNRLSLKISI